MTIVTTIIKYNQVGSSNVRTRSSFEYEFPTQLYMIITD